MNFSFVTLFPEMCDTVMKTGVLGRGVDKGLLRINTVNFRDFTTDKHRSVDDTPYGGGPGMLLKAQPVVDAVESLNLKKGARVLMMTPGGRKFDQEYARDLSQSSDIVFLCGRYEGFDERVSLCLRPEEVSVGDFVMTGGELAALSVADSVSRLIPGVLGDDQSSCEESFSEDSPGIEYPQYTRPRVYRGHAVPQVLLDGNHKQIEDWKQRHARARTLARRPDLKAS